MVAGNNAKMTWIFFSFFHTKSFCTEFNRMRETDFRNTK